MFTTDQQKTLDTVQLEAHALGLRHLDADDPLDWLDAFAYARAWAKWEGNAERAEKLDELSAHTTTVLDDATAPR